MAYLVAVSVPDPLSRYVAIIPSATLHLLRPSSGCAAVDTLPVPCTVIPPPTSLRGFPLDGFSTDRVAPPISASPPLRPPRPSPSALPPPRPPHPTPSTFPPPAFLPLEKATLRMRSERKQLKVSVL